MAGGHARHCTDLVWNGVPPRVSLDLGRDGLDFLENPGWRIFGQMSQESEHDLEMDRELLIGFLDESCHHLASLNEKLLSLEEIAKSGPIDFQSEDEQEMMNEMFRSAHSLKGLAAAFGFEEVLRLTHVLESFFDLGRKGSVVFTHESLDVLLEGVGALEELVSAYLEDPSGDEIQASDMVQTIEACMEKAGRGSQSSHGGKEEPQAEPESELEEEEPEITDTSVDLDAFSLLDDPELRKVFLETTLETVDSLDQSLLELENRASPETLNEVFRAAHNLKGAFGTAGLRDLRTLTHEMETVLDRLRKGSAAVSDDLISLLLQVADRVRAGMEALKAGEYAAWDLEQVQKLVKCLRETQDESVRPQPLPVPISQGEEESVPKGSIPEEGGVGKTIAIRIAFDPEHEDIGLLPFMALNQVGLLGKILSCDPDPSDPSTESTSEFCLSLDPDEGVDEEVVEGQLRGLQPKTLDVQLESEEKPGEFASPGSPPEEEQAGPKEEACPGIQELASDSPQTDGGKTGGGPKKASSPPKLAKAGETIRVDVERLDSLMNLGGELVINRARFVLVERELNQLMGNKDFSYLVRDLEERLTRAERELESGRRSGDEKRLDKAQELLSGVRQEFFPLRGFAEGFRGARQCLGDLGEAVSTLERLAGGLQKQIMDTRMVPVGPLFTRFRRVVRDISKTLGKKIELKIHGEHTELDKRMIDELADPLTHMIRNSGDHGIESPEKRVELGKDEVATISLDAFHQGNSICIEVRDDGAGIDREKILQKALARGLVTEVGAAQMSDNEILQFIFHPGFSTAETVSDLSGRGMGMDIVVAKLAALNGTVEVHSEVGKGTRFVLRLPLTMAITSAILARIGKETYAIPLDSVSEILTTAPEEIRTVQGRYVLPIRDRILPAFFLGEIMDLNIEEGMGTKNLDEWTVVVLSIKGERICLVVDEMLGQEEIVIKGLSENFHNIPGFAGATILGDGRVALILDVAWLLQECTSTERLEEKQVENTPVLAGMEPEVAV